MTTVAEVVLWGRTIGAVSLADGERIAAFEYDRAFAASQIQVSPIHMPLRRGVYRFPALPDPAFHGLPGLLADALPDRYGNALINAWLATQGRSPGSFNAVERLCYTGTRGMGALEFKPVQGPSDAVSAPVDIPSLVALAGEILARRHDLHASFDSASREEALTAILRVGSSAGGARPKALVAWNETTNEVRSGQTKTGDGFGYWLLKFDGVEDDADRDLSHSKGFSRIEYAYYRMARDAGIRMSESRLFPEGGRHHFITKRFDRLDGGEKLHMQTFGGLAHLDFDDVGAHAYEQAFQTIRTLALGMDAIEEQFRRMVFNIVARNQDDHVKNIAFLMDKSGKWSLSPAYDLSYSYNPDGAYTSKHQMSINGKHDAFERADLKACAKAAGMKRGRADSITDEVLSVVLKWPEYAQEAGVPADRTAQIQAAQRTWL